MGSLTLPVDQTREEMDEKIGQLFSLLGVPGSDQPDYLVDLAEFDEPHIHHRTLLSASEDDRKLDDWLLSVSPIQR